VYNGNDLLQGTNPANITHCKLAHLEKPLVK